MHNYHFLNLNDKEFEVLVNDLLAKRENATVDRFKPGKDGGIDGRFFEISGSSVIIQSKHYARSGFSQLKSTLKTIELPKIKKLNPNRYILATSVELSNAEKQELISLLSPYIKNEIDIIGKENLNDLLGQHSDVEKNHYKLWLSSTNILNAITNNAIVGRSRYKIEEITKESQLYVYTKSFDDALEALSTNGAIIITGEAGIGKTTVANQLALHFAANGFEFIFIEDDISEAESVYEPGKKQFFLYDDFLGRNYLSVITGRKDSRTLSFIERVSQDKNKRFVLTSRATILAQGKSLSDLFDIAGVDEKAFEIRFQDLSDLDKAKILYNHIWLSLLEESFIEEIYKQKRYREIIGHRNYNPRLVSFICDATRLGETTPEAYWSYIHERLENPAEIWDQTWANQLDDLMRCAVSLVVFNGGKIDETIHRKSLRRLALKNELADASNFTTRYKNVLKKCVGTVLNRVFIVHSEVYRFELFNPSVGDFVISQFQEDEDYIWLMLSSLVTTESAQTLSNLSRSEILNDGTFGKILKRLLTDLVAGGQYDEDNFGFLILCSQLATKNIKKIGADAFELIYPILSVSGNWIYCHGLISESCDVLMQIIAWIDDEEVSDRLILDFLELCSSYNPGFEELESLFCLAEELSFNADKLILDDFRSYVVESFELEVSEIVVDDGVLDYYDELEEVEEARKALRIFLEDKFGFMDLNPEQIDRLVALFDIELIIEENLRARVEDYSHEYLYEKPPPSFDPQGTADEQIEDLFHR